MIDVESYDSTSGQAVSTANATRHTYRTHKTARVHANSRGQRQFQHQDQPTRTDIRLASSSQRVAVTRRKYPNKFDRRLAGDGQATPRTPVAHLLYAQRHKPYMIALHGTYRSSIVSEPSAS